MYIHRVIIYTPCKRDVNAEFEKNKINFTITAENVLLIRILTHTHPPIGVVVCFRIEKMLVLKNGSIFFLMINKLEAF